MSVEHHVADRVADVAGAAGVIIPAVATIAELNLYLQAGAYIFGMISAACAAYYYVTKAHSKS